MARETADERPRWVRALQRSMIADTGKSLGAPPPFAYGQDRRVGLSKAVKTVAPCARVHAWSRGGCDDSSGDTRLARGLPCGRMPLGHPSHPMPEGSVQREGEEMARATRRPGGGQQRSVAPAGDAQRSESSSTWTSGSRRTDMLCTAYSAICGVKEYVESTARRPGNTIQQG